MTTVVVEKGAEMKETSQEQRMSLENVRRQILTFGNEIHAYLEKVEANVEGYKFSVEKHGDGVEVEVEFKALIHPKPRPEKIQV